MDGGFSQFHVCAERQLHDVGGSPLSAVQLACLPTAYGTALGMINRAECVAGERVLVTGSSGGVGMAAVQLLVDRGCEVVAHTSASKREFVSGLGVAEVSVRGQDISEIAPVDAVVGVGGGGAFGAMIDRLRDGGRRVWVCAVVVAPRVAPVHPRPLPRHHGRCGGRRTHRGAGAAGWAKTAVAGGAEPVVAETYPLAEIAEAQRRFAAKDIVGKLVLEP